MSSGRVYLDHNATSPMRAAVVTACQHAFQLGNPSSVHAEGRAARAAIERSRSDVAALVGARAADVVFTSGGTEGNNAILRPGAILCREGRPVTRLLVGDGEHASVLAGHRFPPGQVERVPIDAQGRTVLAALDTILARSDAPTLVSIQAANNETGAIQPLAEISAMVEAHGASLHVDAVQAAGRIGIDFGGIRAAGLTISSHKLGGPMGVGAVAVAVERRGPDFALVSGGGQERGARGGTENVAGIVGFGVAAAEAARALSGETARLRLLRDEAEQAVRHRVPNVVVFAGGSERLPNTLAFAVGGIRAETALMALDLDGVAVSSGSACSSGKVGRSHVLAAMGVKPDVAMGAIRVSFGWNSTLDDVHRFAAAFETMLQRLYKPSRALAA